MKTTIINIVSGKGGTGKTLLAAVLGDMLGNVSDTKVLIVDMDFFVRGLTSLLYFHRDEKLQITDPHEMPVAQFFIQKTRYEKHDTQRIAIVKYRSFDVLPAVSRIDERLNYQDIGPDNKNEARSVLQFLLSQIPKDYRFVILDSRAGYDELISVTHELSDVSICVEEQDPISRVTADNLVSQLDNDSKTPLFRLTNKARGISSAAQIDADARSVTDLGLIPFDMDVMNSFGSKDFWEQISRSLYRWALAKAWNRLSSKLQLKVDLELPRLSPIASERAEARIGFLTSRNRIMFVYGLTVAAMGLGYALAGRDVIKVLLNDPFRGISVIFAFVGLTLALTSLTKK